MSQSASGNPDVVRHFGLTLVEHSIKYKFNHYDEAKRLAIRNWVVDLALSVRDNEPHYLKEKISFLWVAIAKRTWGIDDPVGQSYTENELKNDGWADMDKYLLRMWNTNNVCRELTLSIFRTLFEDLYILDDPIAAKRASILSAQCIEIVTSESILETAYESRLGMLRALRADDEGWLHRWSNFLGQCLQDGIFIGSQSELFACKILETLKTCLYWVFPLAIRKAELLDRLSMCLALDNVRVRTLATDCLHVLFTRVFTQDEDFQAIVGAVFRKPGMDTLANVYSSVANLDMDDFDEQKYVLLKKLVEMIVGLGEYLNLSKNQLPEDADLRTYLRLVLETTRHPSLMVSGLSLQFWCSVLRVEQLAGKDEVAELLPELLETATDRCLKYEDLPEDHVSRRYIDLDFDSLPESHAFLGNYRRFIEDILRLVVCKIPIDSLQWLRQRMEAFFSSQLGWESLNSNKLVYDGNQAFYLAYSQFMIVEAALKGVARWKVWYQEADKEERMAKIIELIQGWSKQLIGMSIKDPVLLRKLVQSLVQFAPVLREHQDIMFLLLEKVLGACTSEYPPNGSDEDNELVRDLRSSCGTELNRLAYMIPGSLMQIYDDLERVIGEIIMSDKLSDHEVVSFKSFLLVVSQRSAVPNKEEKFSKIVDPVLSSWSDEGTIKGLMDLPWFMERIGIVKIAEYFRSRGVTANTDLLSAPMDDEGRRLKTELKKTWAALFPIRATRIFIQYTIEKLDHKSPEYLDLLKLWKPRIQPILPHILQLIAQIEAYHNPENWKDLPSEVQSFVKYSTAERFWQIGVSTQTRDEFVDDSVKAMHTLRDFADSVGHAIRYTREYAFLTLGSISQLEDTMYEIPGMATNVWVAIAGDSAGITSHSWRHMISLSIRSIIRYCPLQYVQSFMSEFLPPMLKKLDEVLVEKWEKVYQHGILMNGDENDENLSEEMMDEHLLRQLTGIVDRLLIDLVGQYNGRTSSYSSSTSKPERDQTQQELLRRTVLENKNILAPFLQLCVHIMQFKDNRCSFNCCLVLRNIVQEIVLKDNEVDQYLSNEVIRACLNILNDSFFADVHSEAGAILATLYVLLRSKHEQPLIVLSTYLPSSITREEADDFEMKLFSAKGTRQQRGVFLEFLSTARALSGQMEESDGNAREAALKKKSDERKKNDKKWLTQKKGKGDDVMNEEIGEDINNLFGQ